MKNFSSFEGSLKNLTFTGGRGVMKNQYREGNCLKRGEGAWTVCQFKKGLGKKEGVVILRGVDNPMQTMLTRKQ